MTWCRVFNLSSSGFYDENQIQLEDCRRYESYENTANMAG